MKKVLIVALAVVVWSVGLSYAQEKISVERSIAGVQLGLGTLGVYNESRLSDSWAFVSRLSLVSGYSVSSTTKFRYLIVPSISISPKYYYNLSRRVEKEKNISHNSANFLALSLNYLPGWFAITNDKSIAVASNFLSLVPTYGIRRSFAHNFNYEFAVGLGYGIAFEKNRTNNYLAGQLNIKIGYDFFNKN